MAGLTIEQQNALGQQAAGGGLNTRTDAPSNFYKTPPTFGSLIYPDDLNSISFLPDCICFTIKKRTGVSIEDVTKAFAAGGEVISKAWNNMLTPEQAKAYPGLADKLRKIKVGESSEKIRQQKTEEIINKFKEDRPDHTLPDSVFDMVAGAIDAATGVVGKAQAPKKELRVRKGGTGLIGSIYLNMPNGIQFNEAANWAGQELGFMGKTTQDFVSGQGATGDTMKALSGALAGSAGGLIGAGVGALPSLVSKLGIGGGMFGAAIGAMAAGGPIQKGMESALGVAQNPYLEMMFSGVGFRKFTFEFILRPKSATEVDTVANILKAFRTFTKPTFTEGKLGKSFMDYPMEFEIAFLTSKGGKGSFDTYVHNGNVPKLKDCVCDNVTSNYTPQSIWAAHDGGVPLAVTLGLSFQETELVMAEDVHRDGY